MKPIDLGRDKSSMGETKTCKKTRNIIRGQY
jgi:hypothetical protein